MENNCKPSDNKNKVRIENNRNKKWNKIVTFLVIIGVIFSIGFTRVKEITVIDSDIKRKFFTTKKTLGALLERHSMNLASEDKISLDGGNSKIAFSGDCQIKNKQTVSIYRASPVTIIDGNTKKQFYKTSNKISEILSECGITIRCGDSVSPSIDSDIGDNVTVSITRKSEDLIRDSVAIPYKKIEVLNDKIDEGTKKIQKEGKDGIRQFTYRVCLENSKQVAKEKIKEEIIKEPIEEVVEIGTKKKLPKKEKLKEKSVLCFKHPVNQTLTKLRLNALASRDGVELRANRVLKCHATAYDASYRSTGKRPGDRGYGITATGAQAVYGVVAVDPSVISLGSKLYIEAPDKSWVYGYAVAADTGGAIKGQRIDLFFNTEKEALEFGSRKANVYIIDN